MCGHPAPEYSRHLPQTLLTDAQRGNPVVVCMTRTLCSKSSVSKTQLRSGHRKVQEAKATGRKARGIYNPVDRALLTQKCG